jgi:hypothetical protein
LENNACDSGYDLKSRSFHFGAGCTSGEKEIALLESLEGKQGRQASIQASSFPAYAGLYMMHGLQQRTSVWFASTLQEQLCYQTALSVWTHEQAEQHSGKGDEKIL